MCPGHLDDAAAAASAQAARSRVVVRAPAGTRAIVSVNVSRAHPGSRHHQRRWCQRSSGASP
jgi:hypothetical protein